MARSTRLAALLLVLGSVMGASIAPHVAAWGRRWPRQVPGPMSAPCSSPPAGVPFLTDQLGAQARLSVEAAFGADLTAPDNTWNWYDITTDVRHDEQGGGVYISPMARSDEFSQAQPAGLRFTLLNPNGDYTKGNPTGRWYPYIRRNTPIRVTVNLTGWAGDTSIRFQGYANGWTPSWDASGNLAVVTLSASGELRRVLQGKPPRYSALYRAVTTDSVQPVAWWPMEDGPQSTRFASGLASGSALTVQLRQPDSVRPSPAAVSPPTGVSAMPNFAGGGSLSASVTGTTTAGWTVEFAGYFGDSEPAEGNYAPGSLRLISIFNTGATDSDFHRWSLSITPHRTTSTGGGIVLTYYDALTASGDVAINDTLDQHNITMWDKATHHFVVSMQDAGGGTTAYRLLIDGVLIGSGTVARAMYSVGPVVLNSDPWIGAAYTFGMAGLAVYGGVYDLASHAVATTGHAGETATDRLIRLCDEAGMPLALVGTSDTAMGPQGNEPLPTLLRECETADGGILHDGLSAGWTYVSRFGMFNQAAALTLDATAGQVALPYGPVDDDQRVRNRVKVNRKDGSTATYERTDGPLGTDTVGVYDDEVTLNVATDDVLDQHAAWPVHRGTITDELRYPVIVLDLRRSPELAAGWLAARAGSRIDLTGLPTVAPQHPPDDVSQMAEGWAEALSPYVWVATVNASPYRPWVVGVIEGTGVPLQPPARVDTDGSSLTTAAASGDTSLAVASSGLVWVDSATYPADFPFDVDLEGEQVTVSAIAGTSSPQTFTATRSVNGVVKAHAAGTPVTLWRPPVIAL